MTRSMIEAVTMACNVDCTLYRQGVCRWLWPHKDECPRVRHYMRGYDVTDDDERTY